VGVTSVPFWSSTASESNATFAQFANLDDGSVADRADKVFALGVWPVRSASR
jgi:hypothetical protein